MNTPKVSIIVPVYNTAKYLPKCLESIINQTLKDIEIIIVNDASTDNSEEIIKKYEKKDSRIKYIKHEKNKGAGGARNTGIKMAKANYIGGVDSDDWIEEDAIEKLYIKACKTKSDVVIGGIRWIVNGKTTQKLEFSNRKVVTSEQKERNIFEIANCGFVNKIWKKNLFFENDCFFPENIIYEDLATIPRLYYFADKIIFIPEIIYNYVERENANTSSFGSKEIDNYFTTFKILKKFCQKEGIYKQQEQNFLNKIYRALFYQLEHIEDSFDSETFRNFLIEIIRRLIKNDIFLARFEMMDKDSIKRVLFFDQYYNEIRWRQASHYAIWGKLKFLVKEIIREIKK